MTDNDTRDKGEKQQSIARALNNGLKQSRELVAIYSKVIRDNAQITLEEPSESANPGSCKSD